MSISLKRFEKKNRLVKYKSSQHQQTRKQPKKNPTHFCNPRVQHDFFRTKFFVNIYDLLCLNFCGEAVMAIKRSIVLEVSLTQIQYNRQTVV